MEACKQYYRTKYVRLPDLLIDLQIAREEGNYLRTIKKYANPVLLIIDEWMLLKPTQEEQNPSRFFPKLGFFIIFNTI